MRISSEISTFAAAKTTKELSAAQLRFHAALYNCFPRGINVVGSRAVSLSFLDEKLEAFVRTESKDNKRDLLGYMGA